MERRFFINTPSNFHYQIIQLKAHKMKAILFSISRNLFGSDENPSFRKEFLVTDKMFRVYGLFFENRSFRIATYLFISALDYVEFAKDEPFSFRLIPTYLGLMVPIFHCFFAITAICYDFNDFDGLMNALIGTAAAFNVRNLFSLYFHFILLISFDFPQSVR